MADVQSTATEVSDIADELIKVANDNPAPNSDIVDAISAVKSSAEEAAAIASGNPVAIATSSFALLPKITALGTDVIKLIEDLVALIKGHKNS